MIATKPWRSPDWFTRATGAGLRFTNEDLRALERDGLWHQFDLADRDRWEYEDDMHREEEAYWRAEEARDRAIEAEAIGLDAYYESLATVIDEGDWYWWTE